jgi:hypothetical protein
MHSRSHNRVAGRKTGNPIKVLSCTTGDGTKLGGGRTSGAQGGCEWRDSREKCVKKCGGVGGERRQGGEFLMDRSTVDQMRLAAAPTHVIIILPTPVDCHSSHSAINFQNSLTV